ncbi:MAG: TlpA family protein disulfide reductase [Acidobacteriaceae bacterium]
MRPRSFYFLTATMVFCLLAISGCDRGAHPKSIGRMAPDFTVTDNGKTVSLGQFRGQMVLLNFWATWCPPCVVELPSLLDLHHRMPNLVILAVSVDTDADTYHKFLETHHVDLLSVRDPSQQSNRLYGTVQFPESYLIDRSGHILRKFIGAQEWTSPDILRYLNAVSAQH